MRYSNRLKDGVKMRISLLMRMCVVVIGLLICGCSINKRELNKSDYVTLGSLTAAQYLIKKVSKYDIVCLGDKHGYANQFNLLIDNLPLLHRAGLRYLVLERWFNNDRIQNKRTSYAPFFSWNGYSDVMEYYYLYNAVKKFNQSLRKRVGKIVIINGEKDSNKKCPKGLSPEQAFNFRDTNTFNIIDSLMQNKSKKDRVLIFYGNGHGALNSYRFSIGNGKKWTHYPFSSLLKKKYKKAFFSINLQFSWGRDGLVWSKYKTSVMKKLKRLPKSIGFDLEGTWFDVQFKQNGRLYSQMYDGVVYFQDTRLGLPFYSIKEFLSFQNLILYLKETAKIFADNSGGKSFFKKNLAATLYYMQKFFNRQLSYSFWVQQKTLNQFIGEMEKEIPNVKKMFKDSTHLMYNNLMYKKYSNFHSYLYLGRDHLSYDVKTALIYLKKAMLIYPNDCYLQYFLYLGYRKSGNYKKAELFAKKTIYNKNLNNLPELPQVIKSLISFCRSSVGLRHEEFRLKRLLRDISQLKLGSLKKKRSGHFVISGFPFNSNQSSFRFGDIIISYNGIRIDGKHALLRVHRANKREIVILRVFRGNAIIKVKCGKRRLGILLHSGEII